MNEAVGPGKVNKSHAGLLLVVCLALVLSACSAGQVSQTSTGQESQEIELAPVSSLPDFVRNEAPLHVQEAYRFAAANPDVLAQYPCYCGCDAVGHESNLDCFVKDIQADGTIVFDSHGFG
jgi:hypothetical protein